MNGEEYINRRQFVIGPKPYNEDNANWEFIKINDNYFLSYSKALPVKEIVDKNNNNIFLIGIAVQTQPNGQDPIKELKYSSETLTKAYESWAGRWIIVNSEELHMDASGLLGCFYSNDGISLWISSSVNILKDILGINDDYTEPLPLGTMNWYPLPRSGTFNINSLLPSQVLLLNKGTVRARQLFPPELLNLSEKDALDIIQSSLVEGLRRVSMSYKNLWIALSAGYDSRLLLAAASQAKVPVKTYTMRKKNRWYFFKKEPATSPVSKADMILPPMIAEEAGVEHNWIDEREFSYNRLQLFDVHTNKRTVENDRVYFARGQWGWPSDTDALLLGQVTEVGDGIFYDSINYNKNYFDKESIIKAFMMNSDSKHIDGIDDYGTWISKYLDIFNESSIDWRDRFYLEQKISGWLSALQQGMDLIHGEKIHLINSQRVICALLALPKNCGMERTHIKRLIERMSPGLEKFPLNPPDPFLYNINKKISSISQKTNPIGYVIKKLKH